MFLAFYLKSALILALVMVVSIIVSRLVSYPLLHHMLLYYGRSGVTLTDTDHRLSVSLFLDPMIGMTKPFVWSPDNQHIAIASFDANSASRDYDIYILSLDNTPIRNVTHSSTVDEAWPAWSPDGKKLAVAQASSLTGKPGIAIQVLETKTWQPISRLAQTTGNNIFPLWSPDGRWLSFISSQDGTTRLYIANTATGKLRLLAENPSTGQIPVWSPDSKYIVFGHWENPADHLVGSNEIYRVDVDSLEEVNLTQNTADDSWPLLSSDGKEMVFISDRDGKPEIYRMNLASGATKRFNVITPGNFGYSLPASLSPDGQWLAITLTNSDGTDVYGFDFSSENLYRLTDGGYNLHPAWQP